MQATGAAVHLENGRWYRLEVPDGTVLILRPFRSTRDAAWQLVQDACLVGAERDTHFVVGPDGRLECSMATKGEEPSEVECAVVAARLTRHDLARADALAQTAFLLTCGFGSLCPRCGGSVASPHDRRCQTLGGIPLFPTKNPEAWRLEIEDVTFDEIWG
jgi:hypothetical protein